MNPRLMKIATLKLNQAVVFGGIITFLFYSAMYDDGSAIQAKITTAKAELEKENAKVRESDAALKRVTQLKESYANLTEQFQKASSQIPTEVQMAEVIRTVDLMAKTSAVTIKLKEPRATIKEDIIEVFPIKVVADGGYSEFTKFFFNLSTIERIFKVRSFIFEAPRDPKKTNRLSLEVEIASYRFVGATEKEAGPNAPAGGQRR